MRFGIIYKERLARARPFIVEAPSFEALSQNSALDFIDPYNCMVEAVVDFDGKRVIRSGMPSDRSITAIVDPDLRQIDSANYAFWFRQSGSAQARTAVLDVDDVKGAMQASGLSEFTSESPENVYVDMLIDFKNQEILPVAMRSDGKLIEVWDGDFGERTPGEWFEREAAGLNIAEMESEECV